MSGPTVISCAGCDYFFEPAYPGQDLCKHCAAYISRHRKEGEAEAPAKERQAIAEAVEELRSEAARWLDDGHWRSGKLSAYETVLLLLKKRSEGGR